MGNKLISAIAASDTRQLSKIRTAAARIAAAQPPGNLRRFYRMVARTATRQILIINM